MGGLGGFEKEGGATSTSDESFSDETTGNDVVDAARDMWKAPDVLTARFLRFLGRLPGVTGRWPSGAGGDECKCLS